MVRRAKVRAKEKGRKASASSVSQAMAKAKLKVKENAGKASLGNEVFGLGMRMMIALMCKRLRALLV